jgi:hypothetical protein
MMIAMSLTCQAILRCHLLAMKGVQQRAKVWSSRTWSGNAGSYLRGERLAYCVQSIVSPERGGEGENDEKVVSKAKFPRVGSRCRYLGGFSDEMCS